MVEDCSISGCRGGDDEGLVDFGAVKLNNTGAGAPIEVVTLLEGGFTLNEGEKPRTNTEILDEGEKAVEIAYVD